MFSKLNTWSSQLRKGTLELSLLSLLGQGEQYGYDIIHHLSREIEGPTFKKGTVYPLLSRLKKEKLIEYRWEESAAGPPRKYYFLTDAGKKVLKDMIVMWNQFKESVDKTIKERDGKQ